MADETNTGGNASDAVPAKGASIPDPVNKPAPATLSNVAGESPLQDDIAKILGGVKLPERPMPSPPPEQKSVDTSLSIDPKHEEKIAPVPQAPVLPLPESEIKTSGVVSDASILDAENTRHENDRQGERSTHTLHATIAGGRWKYRGS